MRHILVFRKHLKYVGVRGVASATYSQIIQGKNVYIHYLSRSMSSSKEDKMLTFGESGKEIREFFTLFFVSLK